MSDQRKQIRDKRKQRLKGRVQVSEQKSFDQRMREVAEALMAEPHTREFLWWLTDQDNLELDPFTGNSKTYHNEGILLNAKNKQRFMKRVNFARYTDMERENSSLFKDKE